jgi:hypothetical protein
MAGMMGKRSPPAPEVIARQRAVAKLADLITAAGRVYQPGGDPGVTGSPTWLAQRRIDAL